MVVEKIHSNIIAQRAKQHVLRLQEGQIVQGKITKLYADRHAQINIGATSLIAHIETSLSVGKSYYFQVQDVGGDIHLRVLQELKGQVDTNNIEALMKQLQVQGSSQHHSFVQQLINNGIPFQRQQLHDAIQLLQTATNKEGATDVIQMMLQQKLPLTDSVFHALMTHKTEDFSTLLKNVYKEIQQRSTTGINNTEATLLKKLETIIQQPISSNAQISQSIHNGIKGNHHVFALAQLLRLVDHSAERTQTIKALQQYGQSLSVQHYPLENIKTNEQLQQVFQQSHQHIEHLLTHQTDIRRAAMKIVSIFHPLQTGTLQASDIPALENMIKNELYPHLPKEVRLHLDSLLSNLTKHNQSTLLYYVQALMNESGYDVLKTMSSLLQQTTQRDVTSLPVQQQFLSHLSNVFQTLGLNMEHEIVQSLQLETEQRDETLLQQSQTVKSLLLSGLQQSGTSQEQAQQLVHFINGLQLQSLTELNQVSQAQFLIPGNKLSLNKDMFLQFESQKQEDGSIDTDYCRVFFVLELKQLQETMIDMQIQKRIVSITIYNDQLSGDNKTQALQQILSTNLETLHYQLSSIQWKPLYENQHTDSSWGQSEVNVAEERYDFRI